MNYECLSCGHRWQVDPVISQRCGKCGSKDYKMSGTFGRLKIGIAVVTNNIGSSNSQAGGLCENRKKPGGCPMHNLQCGYPACDRSS